MDFYTNQKSSDLLFHYLAPKMEEKGIRLVMDLNYQKIAGYPDSRLGYLKSIIDDARQDGIKVILADVTIDSPSNAINPGTGQILGHAVALKIDLNENNKRIIYQDPKGYGLPLIMQQDLQSALPGFTIRELKVQQQGEYNTTECGPLTVENLKRLADSDDVAPYLDTYAVRRQHNDDLSQRAQVEKK